MLILFQYFTKQKHLRSYIKNIALSYLDLYLTKSITSHLEETYLKHKVVQNLLEFIL